MVGRRLSQQPASGDAHSNGASKFRRTISHGLAFISNPLSQRKTTPGRQPSLHPTLAVTAPVTGASSHQCDALISPMRNPTAPERPIASAPDSGIVTHHDSPTKSADVNEAPTALLRSRTTSFLPLPVRSGSDASVHVQEKTIKPKPIVAVTDPRLCAMQSKIPTPSPPLSERRVPSPRQYLLPHTSRREQCVGENHAFVGNSSGSPSKVVVRSRTTPNLVKASNSPQPAHDMTPKRAGYKRPAATPAAQKIVLRENMPTFKRASQRQSQIQDKAPRRESQAVPTTIANRKSLGQTASHTHIKQTNQATPHTAKKRLSSNLAQQTPVTARRVQPKEQDSALRNSSSIAQSRLMGPRNPSTPTTLPAEAVGLALPPSNTEKDLQRKTLGTPNGLGGIWRSSRALAAANHEVRRLPRSSTFHNFGTSLDCLPPIPPIPDQYRTPSLSSFFQPRSAYNHHSKMASAATSCESISEEHVKEVDIQEPAISALSEPTPAPASNSSQALAAPAKSSQTSSSRSTPSTLSTTNILYKKNERPWSVADQQPEDNADIEPYYQVRDYMPPLYWAGRFQSRYDHWRTEAMMAELNLKYVPEGQLGECRLSQDKLAACYIFAQLRELCLTEQAADSLWVCGICALLVRS